jgi:hypothetical protein
LAAFIRYRLKPVKLHLLGIDLLHSLLLLLVFEFFVCHNNLIFLFFKNSPKYTKFFGKYQFIDFLFLFFFWRLFWRRFLGEPLARLRRGSGRAVRSSPSQQAHHGALAASARPLPSLSLRYV